jgi:hypothetical protein
VKALPFVCKACRFTRILWVTMAAHYRQSPGHRPIYIMSHGVTKP